ncbi:MAG: trehalose-phosphatase [Cyclobacteriaceae bacterium]
MKDFKENKNAEDLPDALEQIDEIFKKIGSKKPALFLDYDGTLTPIVSNPENAILSDEAKEALSKLSEDIKVAIISGRDRKDIKKRIDIENLIYAGSHGFDIKGPNNINIQYEPGKKALPQLDEAENQIQDKLKDIKGAQVERKKYAIAVHYRNVDESEIDKVKDTINKEVKAYNKLKIGTGKMILELKPDLDWDKGRALERLMEELKLSEAEHVPIFIGDDVTDEDALKAVRKSGVGIIVGSHDEKTAASYRLEDSSAVMKFLDELLHRLKK